MKTIPAVAMLLMASQAILIKENVADSLWDDEDDERETLASIQSAEKEHNHKIKEKITNADMRDTVQEKTVMKFKDDEFVKNDLVYPSLAERNKSFLQLGDDLGRPIGEVLLDIGHPADTDNYDEEADTLESLKSAERVSGEKMQQASYLEKVMSNGSGNVAQDFLADDDRIYTKYLSDAFTDKDAEEKMNKARLEKEKAKQAAKKKTEKKEVKKAEDFLAMHFNQDDDLVQIRFIDGADVMVKGDGN